MAIKIGKHTFKLLGLGLTRSRAWQTTDGRLVVRPSVTRAGMWVADYKVGGDCHVTMKHAAGYLRRFKTKENAMRALVKFWDNL